MILRCGPVRCRSAAVASKCATSACGSRVVSRARSLSSTASSKRHATASAEGPATLRGYTLLIGVEVHAQLLTASKLFSSASTVFASPVNTHVSLFDAALPGTLPTLNRNAIDKVIAAALCVDARICHTSRFERKHYSYADLPLGYQITQRLAPMTRGGSVRLQSGRRIDLIQMQLEQDSGKSMQTLRALTAASTAAAVSSSSLAHNHVDLNRAGIALVEIVSTPQLQSAEECIEFLRLLLRALNDARVTRADMHTGSVRCDVNLSVHRKATPQHTTAFNSQRIELKNMNSLAAIRSAIQYEFKRIVALCEQGEGPRRETRTFDAITGVSRLLRSKEALLDYRFMPEPDLLPVRITPAHIDRVRLAMPETKLVLIERGIEFYQFTRRDASVLCSIQDAFHYMQQCVHEREVQHEDEFRRMHCEFKIIRSPQRVWNWITSILFGVLAQRMNFGAAATVPSLVNSKQQQQSSSGMTGSDDNAPLLASDEALESNAEEIDDNNNEADSTSSTSNSLFTSMHQCTLSPLTLGQIIDLCNNQMTESSQKSTSEPCISTASGKLLLDHYLDNPQESLSPLQLAKRRNMLLSDLSTSTDDDAARQLVRHTCESRPQLVEAVRANGAKAKSGMGALIGCVLATCAKQARSPIPPQRVRQLILQHISESDSTAASGDASGNKGAS